MNAEQLLQVVTWHSMGEQMSGEQGEGSPTHHPHMPPHGVIAEGEVVEGEVRDGQDMVAMGTRLAELQSKCEQQHQVKTLVPHVLAFVFDHSSAVLQMLGT